MWRVWRREWAYLWREPWDFCLLMLAPLLVIVVFASMFYAGKAEHLLMTGDIPVIQSDRGGQVIGTSPVVIGCAVIAILALVLRVVLDKKLAIAADAMSVVAGITLVVAAAQFISPRVNTIASIMTFTNNAQTMADLSSAIYGTAALLIAVVLNIIAAFTNVNEQ